MRRSYLTPGDSRLRDLWGILYRHQQAAFSRTDAGIVELGTVNAITAEYNASQPEHRLKPEGMRALLNKLADGRIGRAWPLRLDRARGVSSTQIMEEEL